MGGLRAANALAILLLTSIFAAFLAAFVAEPASASSFELGAGRVDPCLCAFTIL